MLFLEADTGSDEENQSESVIEDGDMDPDKRSGSFLLF